MTCRNGAHDLVFWQDKLKSSFQEQEKLYNRSQKLIRWKANPKGRCLAGGGMFICFGSYGNVQKGDLIRTLRKLKQLKNIKIPYVWERIQTLKYQQSK